MAGRFCREPRDFELAAEDWMKSHGFPDAHCTAIGPDAGFDVVAKNAVAQVKEHMIPVGRPDIQRLRGAAHRGETALFFSLTDYTADAYQFADDANVALYRFSDYSGGVEAVNGVAERLMRAAAEAAATRREASERAWREKAERDAKYLNTEKTPGEVERDRKRREDQQRRLKEEQERVRRHIESFDRESQYPRPDVATPSSARNQPSRRWWNRKRPPK